MAKTIEAIKIIKFAGTWKELPEEKFRDFGEEVEQRRQILQCRDSLMKPCYRSSGTFGNP